ncbi:MAG: 50S ribosomal protein L24 [Candidatus Aenigmarchaeota archaeon]|nr:50S ribosomal protein L24 [Candidatus Aenigmarchaeota archaeon]
MKKKWSRHWGSSKQPRKQRKFVYNAPLHVRQRLVSATLDKKLRKEFGRRSMSVRKGDEVAVMRGKYAGKSGKIIRVDLKKLKIYAENIKMKKPSGAEVDAALDASNVRLIKLNMEDVKRRKFLEKKKLHIGAEKVKK